MKLDGREVEDVAVNGVDRNDHPDYCDAYFESATWVDTDEALTEYDLLRLQDLYPDKLHEMAEESAF